MLFRSITSCVDGSHRTQHTAFSIQQQQQQQYKAQRGYFSDADAAVKQADAQALLGLSLHTSLFEEQQLVGTRQPRTIHMDAKHWGQVGLIRGVGVSRTEGYSTDAVEFYCTQMSSNTYGHIFCKSSQFWSCHEVCEPVRRLGPLGDEVWA